MLKKRYSDPNDLPDVTVEEIRRSLQSASTVLARYDSGVRRNAMLSDRLAGAIISSLTTDQIATLVKDGLSMA